MKIHCVVCGINEELNSDELKEVSEFIMNNNLEAVDYLSYITLKKGKKCTNNKKHTFLFDIEWQEQLIKLIRDEKDNTEKQIANEKVIEDLRNKIGELEDQKASKIIENTDLDNKQSDIRKRIVETTGNVKLELWK